MVTASMLYNLVGCPHRVTMDRFGDPNERDQVSPFIQILWDRGSTFEIDVMSRLSEPFVDLSASMANFLATLTTIRQSIIDYNGNYCRAARVMLDGIRALG